MRAILLLLTLVAFAVRAAEPHSEHKASATKTPSPTKEEPRTSIDVAVDKQEKMGLKTAIAKKTNVEHTIRTVGNITADQTKEAHVHTKINGWIEKVYADFVGKPVKKGQPLYELYSPELLATQEEYLAARGQGGAAKEIAKAAADRLRLWEVPTHEMDAIGKSGKAKRSLTFDSPVSGFILNKTAIQGMYITPEMELYHIADLSRVWILVTLYEYDIAIIAKGDKVDIQLPYQPGTTIKGEISYVYPEVDSDTRTAKARIELSNVGETLKPGMFANVEIKKSLGEAVVVADDAVIDTGTRKIVFTKGSQTKFEPKEVKIGPRVGNQFVILDGLSGGEAVVSSAHFLIDAESKFQAALQAGKNSAGHSGHGGH